MNELPTDDFKNRRQEFLTGYGKLVEEFKCDFLTRPVFIPSNDENRTWHFTFDTQVMDTSDAPIVSPFQM